MLRQYRLDRYNGLEILVCEVFHRHTWTQAEFEAFQRYSEVSHDVNRSEFALALDVWLNEEHDSEDSFFGLVEPIPLYDPFPAIVLRGVVVDNRPASLQVDYIGSVLSPEIVDEVNRFYGVFDSRHWRNMVSHQLTKYGSLFDSDND